MIMISLFYIPSMQCPKRLVAAAAWRQCDGQQGRSAVVAAAFLQLGCGKKRSNGVCITVLAAAALWRHWQSGGDSAAAA